MRQFSLKEVFVTAVVTLFVAGFGGAVINGYVARAKPTISVTSLGFAGKVIKISDAVKEASAEDVWGDSLERFVDFETLVAREKKANGVALRLETAKKDVDKWLGPASLNKQKAFDKNSLRETPYLRGHPVTIGSHIYGNLRRRQFSDLPVPLERVMTEFPDILWPLEQAKGRAGWRLHLGRSSILFKTNDSDFSQQEYEQQRLIAESFARGVADNIVHIHKTFSDSVATEILKLRKLRDVIRNNLATKAQLAVTVSISNTGGTPIVLEPYLAGEGTLGEERLPFILTRIMTRQKPAVPPTNEVSNLLQQLQTQSRQNRRGDKFLVEEYLPRPGTSPYIAVRPGTATEVTLTSLKPMSERGPKLLKIFEAGVLQFRVVAQSLDGAAIASEPSTFGRGLSADRKERLEELANSTGSLSWNWWRN